MPSGSMINGDQVTLHIGLLAAPIYVALLQRHWTVTARNIPPEELNQLRCLAITQAQALWLDTLERETPP